MLTHKHLATYIFTCLGMNTYALDDLWPLIGSYFLNLLDIDGHWWFLYYT